MSSEAPSARHCVISSRQCHATAPPSISYTTIGEHPGLPVHPAMLGTLASVMFAAANRCRARHLEERRYNFVAVLSRRTHAHPTAIAKGATPCHHRLGNADGTHAH